MLHNRENIQDVLLCEGRLVAAVKVILLYQELEGNEKQRHQGHLLHNHEAGRGSL